MSEWISVEDRLPNPFEVVWIYWRDREVVFGCRTYEGREAIECDPSEGWYSFEHEKCRYTRYWMSVKDSLLNKPEPPQTK